MTGYWDDIDEFNDKEHKRVMTYIKKQHEYKMAELKKEVELYHSKQKVKDAE